MLFPTLKNEHLITRIQKWELSTQKLCSQKEGRYTSLASLIRDRHDHVLFAFWKILFLSNGNKAIEVEILIDTTYRRLNDFGVVSI